MDREVSLPDGGWGWVVVAGTAIINIFNQSILSIFGLLFGSKLEAIAGTTGVTTVMSINCTVTNFSGLLISPLSKYFSTKQITQIGVLLVSAGLTLASFTDSYVRVALGYGILTGLGLGLIASSTFLIINSYFVKNKSQAVGLSMAGTSIGQMVMPLVVAHLIQHYSYDGTILILAALSLHGLIGSMFFEPVSKHMLSRNKVKSQSFTTRMGKSICCVKEKTEINRHEKVQNNNINKSDVDDAGSAAEDEFSIMNEKQKGSSDKIIMNNILRNGAEDKSPLSEEKSQEESMIDVVDERKSKSCWEKIVKLFDLQILKDPVFVHIMVGLSFAYTTSISFSTFFPLFLTEDLDLTVIDASTCMSVLSFLDFIGRILVPLITKQVNVTHRTTFIIGSLILAVSRSMLVIQTEYTMLIVFSAVCGLARAATVINQNLVIAEYSKEAVSSAVGLNMVSKGVFVLTIGELLGMYKDSAHNFAGCIQILNIISMGVVISWSTELIFKWTCRKTSS